MATPRQEWGCDDVTEGTLHNGVGDARVNGLPGMQSDAETDECIASLERARREGRERSRATACGEDRSSQDQKASAAAVTATDATALFDGLDSFTLRSPSAGGPELKLYDAMASPDRQLIKAGYFVAEGSVIAQ